MHLVFKNGSSVSTGETKTSGDTAPPGPDVLPMQRDSGEGCNPAISFCRQPLNCAR